MRINLCVCRLSCKPLPLGDALVDFSLVSAGGELGASLKFPQGWA